MENELNVWTVVSAMRQRMYHCHGHKLWFTNALRVDAAELFLSMTRISNLSATSTYLRRLDALVQNANSDDDT